MAILANSSRQLAQRRRLGNALPLRATAVIVVIVALLSSSPSTRVQALVGGESLVVQQSASGAEPAFNFGLFLDQLFGTGPSTTNVVRVFTRTKFLVLSARCSKVIERIGRFMNVTRRIIN